MMEIRQKVLVVDDEQDICDVLKFNLVSAGYEVEFKNSAEEALELDLSIYDVILLDVMMGQMSGFDLIRRLKKEASTSSIPIIFITARGEEDDRVEGLELGAEDYIVKPFSVREVLARVKVVLSREKKRESPVIVRYKGIVINDEKHQITIDDEEVYFTPTEYLLLKLFLENKGKIFSREQLLKIVWPQDVIVTSRTVDVNIARLRKKIGPYGANLVAKVGFGYLIED